MLLDRQTHTQTDRQIDHNTPLPYWGGVITYMITTITINTVINTKNDHACSKAPRHTWRHIYNFYTSAIKANYDCQTEYGLTSHSTYYKSV